MIVSSLCQFGNSLHPPHRDFRALCCSTHAPSFHGHFVTRFRRCFTTCSPPIALSADDTASTSCATEPGLVIPSSPDQLRSGSSQRFTASESTPLIPAASVETGVTSLAETAPIVLSTTSAHRHVSKSGPVLSPRKPGGRIGRRCSERMWHQVSAQATHCGRVI
jgi:hypothetical protein